MVWQALYECMTSRKHDWKSDVVSPAKAGRNKTTKTSVSLKQYTDVVDHVSSTNTFMSFLWLFYCLICGTVNLFSGLSQTLRLRNWQQHGLFLSVSYFSHKSMPFFVLVLAITLLSKKLQHESLDIRQFSPYIKVMYLTTSMEAPGNYFIIWLNQQKKKKSLLVQKSSIHPSSAAYLILVSQGTSLPWACHPALLKGGYKLPHAARSRCPHLLIPAAICKLIPSVTTQSEARNLNQP